MVSASKTPGVQLLDGYWLVAEAQRDKGPAPIREEMVVRLVGTIGVLAVVVDLQQVEALLEIMVGKMLIFVITDPL